MYVWYHHTWHLNQILDRPSFSCRIATAVVLGWGVRMGISDKLPGKALGNNAKWDTTCKTAWHFGKWWKMVALSCLKSLPLLASCLHLSNEGDFTSLVTKSLISKDHNFSKDILCVQQCSVFMHGTPSALHVREGMLTLVKQTFSCPLEWGLKKSLPGMMCKAAGKPARRAY